MRETICKYETLFTSTRQNNITQEAKCENTKQTKYGYAKQNRKNQT